MEKGTPTGTPVRRGVVGVHRGMSSGWNTQTPPRHRPEDLHTTVGSCPPRPRPPAPTTWDRDDLCPPRDRDPDLGLGRERKRGVTPPAPESDVKPGPGLRRGPTLSPCVGPAGRWPSPASVEARECPGTVSPKAESLFPRACPSPPGSPLTVWGPEGGAGPVGVGMGHTTAGHRDSPRSSLRVSDQDRRRRPADQS